MSVIDGASVLADSASRPLGGFIGKTKMLRDIGYSAYFRRSKHVYVLFKIMYQEYRVTKSFKK